MESDENQKSISRPIEQEETTEKESTEAEAETGEKANHQRKYQQDGAPVIQSRSIFSHEDSFIYGNPKDLIRNIEPVEIVPETHTMSNEENVLDLSCKLPVKTDDVKSEQVNAETYHSLKRNLKSEPVSGLDFVNRKPSIPEQLQIAKIQRQQRKAAQQQQKMLQQMRRTMENPGKSANDVSRSMGSEQSPKIPKHYDHSDISMDSARKRNERLPFGTNSYFNLPHYPYYDPVPSKELPDGHPILPLFDPVYFSALYNAHGYLPPSSPSIAAAFISTLHEILPKLPNMISPPPPNNISPPKTHEQQNS